ncbi:MAG: shikimate kinase [Bacteriovoracaceae bacterium]
MALCEKILITGFSGSGKSTLMRGLKSGYGSDWEHLDDLDQLILKNHFGFQSIQHLVEEKGWSTFRLWERQELDSWLKEGGSGVLAMGGGALNPMLFDLLKNNRKIKFCYLETSFEECWRRLNLDSGEVRPLVKQGKENLFKIYQERSIVFNQITWKIPSTNPQEVLETFLKDCRR